jgi:hypothetical protein
METTVSAVERLLSAFQALTADWPLSASSRHVGFAPIPAEKVDISAVRKRTLQK